MLVKLKWALLAVGFVTLLFMSLDKTTPTPVVLAEDAVVLAFGDSLTYGYGAVSNAYPVHLEQFLNRKVINAGISGEVSAMGLKRLPQLLQRYHPQLLILCHGGNDILRKQSKIKLKSNLLQMVTLAQASGAKVLVVGVPSFSLLGAKTLLLYKEVSEEKNTLYEGAVLEKIEQDPSLKSDQIHPNAEGYKMMAIAFQKVIEGY